MTTPSLPSSRSRYTYIVRFPNHLHVTSPTDTVWESLEAARTVIHSAMKSGLCTRLEGNTLLRQVQEFKKNMKPDTTPERVTSDPQHHVQKSREYRERKKTARDLSAFVTL